MVVVQGEETIRDRLRASHVCKYSQVNNT
jgi:hypothetical protein